MLHGASADEVVERLDAMDAEEAQESEGEELSANAWRDIDTRKAP